MKLYEKIFFCTNFQCVVTTTFVIKRGNMRGATGVFHLYVQRQLHNTLALMQDELYITNCKEECIYIYI